MSMDPPRIQTALAHHNAGQLQQAEIIYRQILDVNPEQPEALFLLGILSSQLGKDREALQFLQEACRLRPTAEAHIARGDVFQRLGQPDQALASYTAAIEIKVDSLEALTKRGNLQFSTKNLGPALEDYDRALTISPTFVMALNNRGSVLNLLGRHTDALAAFTRAISLQPDFADAYYNSAVTLNACGRPKEALLHYEKAIALEPSYVAAHNNLGNLLVTMGQFEEACHHFKQAILFNPLSPEAHNNLGNTYKERGLYDEALSCYKKALDLNPSYPDAYYNQGQVLRDQGEQEQALTCYTKALALKPFYPEARWAYAMNHIPLLLDTFEKQATGRAAFFQELDILDLWFDQETTAAGYRAVGVSQPFYLAYQEEDNRSLLEKHGRLCARLMHHWQSHNNFNPLPAPPMGPVQIGIVSSHLHNHSVWHAIIKGWLKYLNHNLFDIHLFHIGTCEDDETQWAREHSHSFNSPGNNLNAAVHSILSKNLDILIYPEIGMDAVTQQLASMRLCPLQVVSWGHPETSGLPTIDYFLSAECFEPPEAQISYSESLIKLPHLGCSYHPLDVIPSEPDLSALGIRSGCPLLISPGVSYKYAPQNDHVFIDIVKRLGDCQIIFFTNHPHDLSKKLHQRLALSFEKAGLVFERTCLFIPWLRTSEFHGLMKNADVFLDTLGFSGFNTALQALLCNLPVVTREGRFMRGRLASGILKYIGLHDLVADSNKNYVDCVVRLVTDNTYRDKIKNQILASSPILLEDQEPLKALQQWLLTQSQLLRAKA